MIGQLLSRSDAGYRRWLASITDDVVADGVLVFCRDSLLERNATYGIGDWLTGCLMIGQEAIGDSSSGATVAAVRCCGPTWAASARTTSMSSHPPSTCGRIPASPCHPTRSCR
ncbi:hypothetical protein Cme02nite_72600 [Catellatospora methionotrophica]|uniref:Uncharacterized protein n=1 Tax=Catellatospora methionotrophica TaxID=121620 RepID=A0A8J3LIH2_9ACTN|nr:hypothetical protein Cme02nite_72600 [Catellatospora methionotrophica]